MNRMLLAAVFSSMAMASDPYAATKMDWQYQSRRKVKKEPDEQDIARLKAAEEKRERKRRARSLFAASNAKLT